MITKFKIENRKFRIYIRFNKFLVFVLILVKTNKTKIIIQFQKKLASISHDQEYRDKYGQKWLVPKPC